MKEKLTENEKKKEFLNSYRNEKMAVKRIEDQIEELRLNKICPSAMIGDGMPHAHDPSDLSAYAARLDGLERELWVARYRRIDAFKKVQQAIEQMEDEREKTLLTYRYLNGMKWEDICVVMDYKWRQIHRIHSDALKNLKMA